MPKTLKIPNVVTEVPGPRSLELYRQEEKTLAPGIQSIASRSKIVVDHGEGSLVTDFPVCETCPRYPFNSRGFVSTDQLTLRRKHYSRNGINPKYGLS